MAKPLWSVRELVILLNICNEQSVAVRSDNSLISGFRIDVSPEVPMKLVLYHVYPYVYMPGEYAYPLKFPTMDLSMNVQEIWNFLKVPPLDLNHQFAIHDEVFDIVVRHRFFHISRMKPELKQLYTKEEHEILKEFRAWWFSSDNVRTNARNSDNITYDEVTTLSVDLFGKDKQLFKEWALRCAQWAS